MKQIGEAATAIATRDQSSQSKTLERVSTLPKRASSNEIGSVVAQVEIDKQIKPLSQLHRTRLIELLHGLGETKEQIELRGRSVVVKETFGTLAFEYWVSDIVLPYSEIIERRNQMYQVTKEKVDLEIDRRCKAIKEKTSKDVDKRIIDYLALQKVEEGWRRRQQARVEKEMHAQKKRFLFTARALKDLDRDSRIRVLESAKRKGLIVTYDDHVIEYIYLMPDKLYPIVEELSRGLTQ